MRLVVPLARTNLRNGNLVRTMASRASLCMAFHICVGLHVGFLGTRDMRGRHTGSTEHRSDAIIQIRARYCINSGCVDIDTGTIIVETCTSIPRITLVAKAGENRHELPAVFPADTTTTIPAAMTLSMARSNAGDTPRNLKDILMTMGILGLACFSAITYSKAARIVEKKA